MSKVKLETVVPWGWGWETVHSLCVFEEIGRFCGWLIIIAYEH